MSPSPRLSPTLPLPLPLLLPLLPPPPLPQPTATRAHDDARYGPAKAMRGCIAPTSDLVW